MCTILYVKKIVSFNLGTFKKAEPFCITFYFLSSIIFFLKHYENPIL